MYIQVKLLEGFNQTLTYKVPAALQALIKNGSLVRVPLRTKLVSAFVLTIIQELFPKPSYTIKQVEALERFVPDTYYITFLEKLGSYYQIPPLDLIKRVRIFLKQKEQEITEPISSKQDFESFYNKTLTQEQQDVYNFVAPRIKDNIYTPVLLHGVTGSGKTEVYKKLILNAIEQQKSVILLLPEVTLAVQFYNLLKQSFNSSIQIYSFHSATSITEKRALWSGLLTKTPLLLIGVHLPITLPISNLGLILIDEEHDTGYQEKKHPRINTKEAALLRASIYKIPIVLGSATPSIATLYTCKKQNWNYFELKNRFKGTFPQVQVVSLLENKNRKQFWITQELKKAIQNCLAKKEQVILFLNRRGYSFFVQCKNCTFIFSCADCSVSLTLHSRENNIEQLICHYCGFSQKMPTNCTSCKAGEKELIKKGIGTQADSIYFRTAFPTSAHSARRS